MGAIRIKDQALSKQPPPVGPVPVPVGVGGVGGVGGVEGPVTVVPVIPVVINKYVPLEEVSISVQITDTSETTLAITVTVPVPPHPKVEVGPTDLTGYSSYSPEVYISPSLQYLYHPSQHASNMLDEPCPAHSAQPAEPAKPTAP